MDAKPIRRITNRRRVATTPMANSQLDCTPAEFMHWLRCSLLPNYEPVEAKINPARLAALRIYTFGGEGQGLYLLVSTSESGAQDLARMVEHAELINRLRLTLPLIPQVIYSLMVKPPTIYRSSIIDVPTEVDSGPTTVAVLTYSGVDTGNAEHNALVLENLEICVYQIILAQVTLWWSNLVSIKLDRALDLEVGAFEESVTDYRLNYQLGDLTYTHLVGSKNPLYVRLQSCPGLSVGDLADQPRRRINQTLSAIRQVVQGLASSSPGLANRGLHQLDRLHEGFRDLLTATIVEADRLAAESRCTELFGLGFSHLSRSNLVASLIDCRRVADYLHSERRSFGVHLERSLEGVESPTAHIYTEFRRLSSAIRDWSQPITDSLRLHDTYSYRLKETLDGLTGRDLFQSSQLNSLVHSTAVTQTLNLTATTEADVASFLAMRSNNLSTWYLDLTSRHLELWISRLPAFVLSSITEDYLDRAQGLVNFYSNLGRLGYLTSSLIDRINEIDRLTAGQLDPQLDYAVRLGESMLTIIARLQPYYVSLRQYQNIDPSLSTSLQTRDRFFASLDQLDQPST